MAKTFLKLKQIYGGADTLIPFVDGDGSLASSTQFAFNDSGNALTLGTSAVSSIVMTPSASDTVTMSAATNGAFSLVTVDDNAAAANIQITADGTVDIDSAGVLTLDSGAAINIEPASGSAILLDGTISIDAGVVTGATAITSTKFDGIIGSDNARAGTFAAIVGTTIDASTDFTIGTTVITDDNIAMDAGTIVMTPSTGDTVTIAGATHGALNITTVDTAAALADVTITVDGDFVTSAVLNTIAGSGDIKLDTDAELVIDVGGAILFKHDGTTMGHMEPHGDGDLLFQDAGQTEIFRLDSSADSLLMATTKKIEFYDATQYIHAPDNANLTLAATTEINLDTATVDLNGALNVSGNSALEGDVDLGNATSDTVTVTGRFDSDLVPSSDSARDFGTSALFWKDAFIDTVTTTGNVAVGGDLALTGDLNVNGNLITVNTSQILLEDDNITIGLVSGSVEYAIDGNATKMVFTKADHGLVDNDYLWLDHGTSGSTAAYPHITGSVGFEFTSRAYKVDDATTHTFTLLGPGPAYVKGDTVAGTALLSHKLPLAANQAGAGISIPIRDADYGRLSWTYDNNANGWHTNHSISIASAGSLYMAGNVVANSGGITKLAVGSITGAGEMTGDVADTDEVLINDGGTIKRADFSVFRDAVFNDVSGDAAIADGGALTIQANAIQTGMVHDDVATELAGAGLGDASGVLSVDAAQTGITSVLNAALALGRDADNQIKFATDDTIVFEVAGGDGVTFKASGEIEAASLDISGDADIDGTMEADAYTVAGVALAEYISDTAGAMFTSNTETGLTVTYEDGDNTIDLVITPAQTTITSIYATDLILGEDSETAIDFGTANEIDFKINNTTELTLDASALYPTSDAGLDLGTSVLEFKDAFFDGTVTSDAFAGPLTGAVTGNASTATALAAAGTIASSGDVVWSVSFSGPNVTAAATIQAASVEWSMLHDNLIASQDSTMANGDVQGNDVLLAGDTSGGGALQKVTMEAVATYVLTAVAEVAAKHVTTRSGGNLAAGGTQALQSASHGNAILDDTVDIYLNGQLLNPGDGESSGVPTNGDYWYVTDADTSYTFAFALENGDIITWLKRG